MCEEGRKKVPDSVRYFHGCQERNRPTGEPMASPPPLPFTHLTFFSSLSRSLLHSFPFYVPGVPAFLALDFLLILGAGSGARVLGSVGGLAGGSLGARMAPASCLLVPSPSIHHDPHFHPPPAKAHPSLLQLHPQSLLDAPSTPDPWSMHRFGLWSRALVGPLINPLPSLPYMVD